VKDKTNPYINDPIPLATDITCNGCILPRPKRDTYSDETEKIWRIRRNIGFRVMVNQ